MPDAGCSARWPAHASRASSSDRRSSGIVFRRTSSADWRGRRLRRRTACEILARPALFRRLAIDAPWHVRIVSRHPAGAGRPLSTPLLLRHLAPRGARSRHLRDVDRRQRRLQRSAALRFHAAVDTRRAGNAQIACAPRTGTAGAGIQCSGAGEEAWSPEDIAQDGPLGPACRRRTRQYLRRGGAPSRRALTDARRVHARHKKGNSARRRFPLGSGDKGCAEGSDQTTVSGRRRQSIPRLRSQRRAVPAARLPRDDSPDHPRRTVDILLSRVSEVTRAAPWSNR